MLVFDDFVHLKDLTLQWLVLDVLDAHDAAMADVAALLMCAMLVDSARHALDRAADALDGLALVKAHARSRRDDLFDIREPNHGCAPSDLETLKQCRSRKTAAAEGWHEEFDAYRVVEVRRHRKHLVPVHAHPGLHQWLGRKEQCASYLLKQ